VPDRVMVAWAAGLFEGEGCVTTGGSMRQAELSLETTDPDVLESFRRVVGVGAVTTLPERRAHHKPTHRWRTAKRSEVEHVMSLLWPFLHARRRARWLEVRGVIGTGERRRKPGPYLGDR
jgi:hypothetical protein